MLCCWPATGVVDCLRGLLVVRPADLLLARCRCSSMPPDAGLHPSTCSKREELAPRQTAEAIEVRRKTDAFTDKVESFRAYFLQKAPFSAPGGELTMDQVRGPTGAS